MLEENQGQEWDLPRFEKVMREHFKSKAIEDRKSLWLLFRRIDRDGSGSISAVEFVKFCKEVESVERILWALKRDARLSNLIFSHQRVLTKADLEAILADNKITISKGKLGKLFRRLDHDGDGTISVKEFISTLQETEDPDALTDEVEQRLGNLKYHIRFSNLSLEKIFSKYDADRSGALEVNEFAKIMKQIDPKLTDLEINAIFNRIDIDDSGSISLRELKETLSELPEPYSKDTEASMRSLRKSLLARGVTLGDLFGIADNDKSGELSLNEFEKALSGLNLTQEKIWFIFRRFDSNSDGSISSKEFLSFFKQMDEIDALIGRMRPALQGKSLGQLLNEFDVDGNDSIDYQEFERLVLKIDDKVQERKLERKAYIHNQY
jgi:Ca2+-binding EF-hand superfamily protein